MHAMPQTLSRALRPFTPLKPIFHENRWAIVLGLTSLLIVDALQLLIPLVIRSAVDDLTHRTATGIILLRQASLILGLALAIGVFRYVWRLLIMGHSRRVERELRMRLYAKMQQLSPAFYHRTRTGDLMARAINDLNAVRMATGMGLVAFTDGFVLGLAAVGFMVAIDVKLAVISLIPAPLIVVLTRILTRRMSAGFDAVQHSFSEVTERVRESFAGIRVLKAYHRERWAHERVQREGEKYVGVNLRLAKTLGLFFPLMAIFTNAGLAVVIGLGGRLAILGDITTGDFVAFTSYLNLLTWPMMAMGWVTNLLQRGSASMRRINRVLDELPEIEEPAAPAAVKALRGEVRMENLTFTYPSQNRPALREIRLRIKPGETVALVGRVGSGKSTLLQIIPRLMPPPPGTVFLDGYAVEALPIATLRRQIAFVTQEPFVFSDTIRNNVLFGRRGLTEEQVRDALDAAGILDEVDQFDRGLDTILGERGITLSGGQRQRLTIARALVLDAPILILDDALAMVDTRTEEAILNSLFSMRRGRTNLIVSHRVSTIRRADRILVLDEGRLVEEGDHTSLLRRRGLYATLYEKELLSRSLETEADA